MKYTRKIYEGDDCVSVIITESSREERKSLYDWCNLQSQDKVMAGHYDHEPQIISFSDNQICEQFLKHFKLENTQSRVAL